MFGLKRKPAAAVDAGVKLMEASEACDAAVAALVATLERRRAALGAYDRTTGGGRPLVLRLMTRRHVDRAVAAGGLQEHITVEYVGNANRASFTDQAKALLGRNVEAL